MSDNQLSPTIIATTGTGTFDVSTIDLLDNVDARQQFVVFRIPASYNSAISWWDNLVKLDPFASPTPDWTYNNIANEVTINPSLVGSYDWYCIRKTESVERLNEWIPGSPRISAEAHNLEDTQKHFQVGETFELMSNFFIPWAASSSLGGGGGGATLLDDLTDVTLSSPANGDLLSFNGSVWVNVPASSPTYTLNDLTDVTITAASTKQHLRYDGSAWVNATNFDNAAAGSTSTVSSNQLLLNSITSTSDPHGLLTKSSDVTTYSYLRGGIASSTANSGLRWHISGGGGFFSLGDNNPISASLTLIDCGNNDAGTMAFVSSRNEATTNWAFVSRFGSTQEKDSRHLECEYYDGSGVLKGRLFSGKYGTTVFSEGAGLYSQEARNSWTGFVSNHNPSGSQSCENTSPPDTANNRYARAFSARFHQNFIEYQASSPAWDGIAFQAQKVISDIGYNTFTVTAAGDVVCKSLTQLSDTSLKTSISTVTAADAMTLLDTLTPIKFKWIDSYTTDRRWHYGFHADSGAVTSDTALARSHVLSENLGTGATTTAAAYDLTSLLALTVASVQRLNTVKAEELNDLTDVYCVAPVEHEVLIHDGSQFINRQLSVSSGDIDGITPDTWPPGANDSLAFDTGTGQFKPTALNAHTHLTDVSYNPLTAVATNTLFWNVGTSRWTARNISASDISSALASAGFGHCSVTVDFGSTRTQFAQTVVTGQTWVTASSVITVTPYVATNPMAVAVLRFSPVISNLVAGTGFTLSVFTEAGATGTYTFSCTGA